jgi:hypothetical protein
MLALAVLGDDGLITAKLQPVLDEDEQHRSVVLSRHLDEPT